MISFQFRDRLFDYPMYKTVRMYTAYGNLKERPVDLYHFNFTSSFSLATTLDPLYPFTDRGASHFDDLLYLFRFRLFDPFFKRDVAENEMKDFHVKLMVDYVRHGESRLNIARPCRRKDMQRGFCEYLDIQRDRNNVGNQVDVTTNNRFDMPMVAINKLIDQIMETYEYLRDKFNLFL